MKIKIEANYLSPTTTKESIYNKLKLGDKNALFAVMTLQPYVLDTDNVKAYNKDDYSDLQLQDRANFLYAYINDLKGRHNKTYIDYTQQTPVFFNNHSYEGMEGQGFTFNFSN